MDFGFTQEQETLREEVRAFIAEEITPAVLAEMQEQDEGELFARSHCDSPHLSELFRRITERGWMGMAYPVEYGGQGTDFISQYIVEEEFYRANITLSLGGTTLGSFAPVIMAAGTQEQKSHYIPRMISGEISFAVGMTEPRGGADLAALQCRAERDGDHFVINGQKVFTSTAHCSTHIYLMVRTSRDAPKHQGISILLFPIDTPGVTVRPLWSIQNDPLAPPLTTYGTSRTNEVFFDNVRVHESALLGAENAGWSVASMGLNLDRVGAGRYLISVMRDEDIINFVKGSRAPGAAFGLADNDAIRDKIAELWIEAQVSRLMTMRSMSIVESGGNFTYEGAAEKVWAPVHGVKTTEAIAQMLGPYGQLLNGSPLAVERGVFAHNLMGAFQSYINHGGVQIMRDQVARRGLGLPRGNRA